MLEPQQAGEGASPGGLMVYPANGWRWLVFRVPFWLWRMGLGPVMGGRFCMLTTIGRTSGKPRHTLLEYAALDGRAYVLAGWGFRSHWVRNLLADPRVTLQSRLGTERGRAIRIVDPDTVRALYPDLCRSPVWHQYTAAWGVDGSDIDDVARNADRLWSFRIDPTDDETPDPGHADLWWVSALLLTAVGLLTLYALTR